MSKKHNLVIEDRCGTVNPSEERLNCLSFFSGAMGLDIGLEKANINVMLACEFNRAARKTIVANDKKIGLIGDIRKYSTAEILEYSNLNSADDVNVIVGGPPCQAFSTAGKRQGLNDARGNVFLKYIDVILEMQPEYAVIENVRGLYYAKYDIEHEDEVTAGFSDLLKQTKGSVLYYVKRKLELGGYSVKFNLYNSADFGAPQKRERVVLICTRVGNPVPYLKPTHSNNPEYGLKKWRTLKHAIGKLQGTKMHGMSFPESRLQYYRILKEGENWTNLSDELQRKALGNAYHLSGGKTGFLRKLAWDLPSPTVVTNPAMPATDLCHPTENRPLSVEEYKAIQEFPKTWKIEGSLTDQYKQIGNAVPVSLGYAIGDALVKHSEGITEEEIANFRYTRYHNSNDDEFIKALSGKENKEKVKQLELQLA